VAYSEHVEISSVISPTPGELDAVMSVTFSRES
jgi:hypothetical protein